MINKPPLSIAHLLLWTAMTAAALALVRYLAMRDHGGDWRPGGWELAWLTLVAIYTGTVSSGVVIWIARRIRGMPYPSEPGEWLHVVLGLLTIVVLAGFYVAEPVETVRMFVFAAWSAIGIAPVIFYRGQPIWRLFFDFLALLLTMPIVASLFNDNSRLASVSWMAFLLGFGFFWSAVALFVGALSTDYHAKQTHRGWLHWVGVGSLISLFAGLLLAFLAPLAVR